MKRLLCTLTLSIFCSTAFAQEYKVTLDSQKPDAADFRLPRVYDGNNPKFVFTLQEDGVTWTNISGWVALFKWGDSTVTNAAAMTNVTGTLTTNNATFSLTNSWMVPTNGVYLCEVITSNSTSGAKFTWGRGELTVMLSPGSK